MVALAVVPAVFHLFSFANGRSWVGDCETARRDYDYARLPDISSRPAPPPETTRRLPPETTRRLPPEPPRPALPLPTRHGWCFDIGGGAAACRDTREACPV